MPIDRSGSPTESAKPPLSAWMKLIVGVLLALSLLSRGSGDPTPLNLAQQGKGIKNLLGIPGALLGGGFLEMFGYAAYLFLLYLIFIKSRVQRGAWRDLVHALFTYLALHLFLSALMPMEPELQVRSFGLIGHAFFDGLSHPAFRLIAALILAGYLKFSVPEFVPDKLPLKVVKVAVGMLALALVQATIGVLTYFSELKGHSPSFEGEEEQVETEGQPYHEEEKIKKTLTPKEEMRLLINEYKRKKSLDGRLKSN